MTTASGAGTGAQQVDRLLAVPRRKHVTRARQHAHISLQNPLVFVYHEHGVTALAQGLPHRSRHGSAGMPYAWLRDPGAARQRDERRARTVHALDDQISAQISHQGPRNAEPQPRTEPGALGGEERIEDVRQRLRGDAWARIGDGNRHELRVGPGRDPHLDALCWRSTSLIACAALIKTLTST